MVETFEKISIDLGVGFFVNGAISFLLSLYKVFRVRCINGISDTRWVLKVDFNKWLKLFLIMYAIYFVLILIIRLC